MAYVDGFVLVIPKKSVKAYTRVARKAGKIWREYGALDYWECVGDDMKAPGLIPFPKLAKAKPSEAVVFSWVVYKSRADRNRIMKKIMTDPRMSSVDPATMPFDLKRLAYGGFKPLVHA